MCFLYLTILVSSSVLLLSSTVLAIRVLPLSSLTPSPDRRRRLQSFKELEVDDLYAGIGTHYIQLDVGTFLLRRQDVNNVRMTI